MSKRLANIIFPFLMLALFSYTAWGATSFKSKASYFPLYISILGIICMIIELIRQFILLRKETSDEPLHPNIVAVLQYTCILVLYVILVYIFGLILATIAYIFAFLLFISKMKWWRAIISVAILIFLIISFGNIMNLYWPKSLLNILTIMFY